MPIVAIDFDGTLCNPQDREPGKKMGKPFPGAAEALWHLKERGYTIVIHTFQGDQKHIHDWLRYFKIPYDAVTNVKPDAVVFVDDRGIGFDGDWTSTMRRLRYALAMWT